MRRTVVLLGLVASLGVACSGGEMPADRAGATQAPASTGSPGSPAGGEARTASAPAATGGTAVGAVLGYVYSHATLDRKPGRGGCGVAPWGNDPGCAMGVKVWWGLHLRASAMTPVVIIPDGPDRWVITNHADVVGKVGIDFSNAPAPVSTYREATVSFSPTPECSGAIEGGDFGFQVMGERTRGRIELVLSATPTERLQGSCGDARFDTTMTHLLWGWAAALSGDPLDLTGVLLDDNMEEPGSYRIEVARDVNPSPAPRDHMKVELGFMCVGRSSPTGASAGPCPWH